MRRKNIVIIAGLALLLVLGAGFQLWGFRDVKEGDRATAAKPVQLASRIPGEADGWTVRDEPLGPNESVRDAVAKNLNYDDYVYRIFQRGGTRFGVYVAYWSPGRMPVNKVASHTPDRCWVENGWRCDTTRFGEVLSVNGSAALLPGQGREFIAPNGEREHVLYWHRVGARLYDYGERLNTGPDPVKWWRDTVAYAFSGSDEQYFVRLTSNRPFAELKNEPAFGAVVTALAKLGFAGAAER